MGLSPAHRQPSPDTNPVKAVGRGAERKQLLQPIRSLHGEQRGFFLSSTSKGNDLDHKEPAEPRSSWEVGAALSPGGLTKQRVCASLTLLLLP